MLRNRLSDVDLNSVDKLSDMSKPKHTTAFWLDILKLLCFGTLVSQKRADGMSPYYVQ